MAVIETPAIIVETIAIEAPIAAVFAALTVPEQLVQWWGNDDSYRVAAMEADVRPGGAWKTTGKSGDGSSFSVAGTYRTVDPPRLVEFTWRHDWADGSDAPETLVRYELIERAGITDLTVTHSGFTTVEDREDHARGWKVVLGWVREFVTRRA
ncbi:MAG: SRPBCC domain-containing protein [Candidatus Eremiobacteraeota bacterium]|nr:SRPBCC domain-containing protein [Candidatus Eremiobacteraeota bacterium]